MKGIVLAGGAGTRLHPLTLVASKQLQPVYDKPMIYYPLATLMMAGITDLLLISTKADVPRFQALLGDGTQWGIRIAYEVQARPEGIAQAFLIGERFIEGQRVALILGDNLFYGSMDLRDDVKSFNNGALIFAYHVRDPERYGVVEFDPQGRVLSLIEKPKQPKSNLAIPGIYLYDEKVVDLTRALRPSARGELEITDLNLAYLERGELRARRLRRGVAWFDTGTHASLLEASSFIAAIENRQGQKVCCPEEVAFKNHYIDAAQLERLAAGMPRSPYREYLEMLLTE